MSEGTEMNQQCIHRESCLVRREERYKAVELLREAHRLLNAQAYEREEMEDFCRRLNDHFGIPNDTVKESAP